MDALRQRIGELTGTAAVRVERLSGGCIGEVFRVYLADGGSVVAKVGDGSGTPLDVEGYMLRYLAQHSRLPVPTVIHSSDTLLVMTHVEGSSSFDARAETHAAELLAELHGVHGAKFGLERDTLIGGLHQPNTPQESWLAFFRDERLLYMAREAATAGRLPERVHTRLRRFAEHLDRWLEEPPHPSLIHGDVWTTNVLANRGRITAFLDPAIYYAHPEIELAFTTLFNTFGNPFFRRYHDIRPIAPGFFETRRDIYNLYPLLTHVRLFGGGYVAPIDRILGRHGY